MTADKHSLQQHRTLLDGNICTKVQGGTLITESKTCLYFTR